MEQHFLTSFTWDHQAKHILYKQQKRIHQMPFFLELGFSILQNPMFCNNDIWILQRKAFYVFLFVCYTKCVLPGDPILKTSKHVAPLNTHTISSVDCNYKIINLKNNRMSNLKIISYYAVMWNTFQNCMNSDIKVQYTDS